MTCNVFVLVFVLFNILYQCKGFTIVSNENVSLIPNTTTPPLPYSTEEGEFDFHSVKKRAHKFYKTLPQTVLDDAMLSVSELVRKYGYPCEVHKVITPDGYILTTHRIPHGRNSPSANRPIVYLQHGILSSSADWVIAGPKKGLGYILADSGYDVWMLNVRGTRYSRNHTHLDPDSKEFWEFSWHEIALNDITTMIDFALETTKQSKLFYIGHSQGTTLFYVMCSEKPEYNEKIRAQISLAPIAFMSHTRSPLLQQIAIGELNVGILLKEIGFREFLPKRRFIRMVGKALCSDESVTQVLCTNALFAVCGFSQRQMNSTLLPIIMDHTPAGAATKQFLHYAQIISSGKFRQWDRGLLGNQKYYNNTEPPEYLLHKITAPVYMFYSRNDWLSGVRDAVRLFNELEGAEEKFLVQDKRFNHMDFVYGKEAPKLIYNKIIDLLTDH